MQGVNGFLLFIKLFKYMTFSDRVRFLFKILSRSALDLFIFMIVMFIVMAAFALAGYCAFASDVKDFRTFGKGFGNLFRYLVTDMNYEELSGSSVMVGNIFYCLWNLMMIIVLANVFIAILCDAYSEVVTELAEKEERMKKFGVKVSMMDKIRRSFMSSPKRFSSLYNNDGKIIDAQRIVKKLRISEDEAKLMINKYDKTGDGKLTLEEYKNLVNDMDKDKDGVLDMDEMTKLAVTTEKNKMSDSNDLTVTTIVDDEDNELADTSSRPTPMAANSVQIATLEARLSKIDVMLTKLLERE